MDLVCELGDLHSFGFCCTQKESRESARLENCNVETMTGQRGKRARYVYCNNECVIKGDDTCTCKACWRVKRQIKTYLNKAFDQKLAEIPWFGAISKNHASAAIFDTEPFPGLSGATATQTEKRKTKRRVGRHRASVSLGSLHLWQRWSCRHRHKRKTRQATHAFVVCLCLMVMLHCLAACIDHDD